MPRRMCLGRLRSTLVYVKRDAGVGGLAVAAGDCGFRRGFVGPSCWDWRRLCGRMARLRNRARRRAGLWRCSRRRHAGWDTRRTWCRLAVYCTNGAWASRSSRRRGLGGGFGAMSDECQATAEVLLLRGLRVGGKVDAGQLLVLGGQLEGEARVVGGADGELVQGLGSVVKQPVAGGCGAREAACRVVELAGEGGVQCGPDRGAERWQRAARGGLWLTGRRPR